MRAAITASIDTLLKIFSGKGSDNNGIASNTFSKPMAKLPDETLTMIFYLLRQLVEEIEHACATEWTFFERYGETPRTISELEELQNVREDLISPILVSIPYS